MVAPQENLFSLPSIFDWLRFEQAAQSLVSSIFQEEPVENWIRFAASSYWLPLGWWTDVIGATLGQSATAGAVEPVFPPVLNCIQNRF